jgi:putative sterol carrier protein
MDAFGTTGAGGADIPAVDPEEFAELARAATGDQLRAGLAVNRELILGEIFRQMPARFDAERGAGVDATIEWRIRGDGNGSYDAWYLIIDDGRCEMHPGPAEDPTATLEIDALDFIRLITGSANGPKLFLFGRLKVRGNVLLAARMPGFFNIPGA